jgi:hypothetical protein
MSHCRSRYISLSEKSVAAESCVGAKSGYRSTTTSASVNASQQWNQHRLRSQMSTVSHWLGAEFESACKTCQRW